MRQRKRDAEFVSRSAYKLDEILKKHANVRPRSVVVDLGAAPGGWTQALRRAVPSAHVFALDKLPLQAVVPGAIFLQGDFMEQHIRDTLTNLVQSKHGNRCIDMVLSDMMCAFFNANQRTRLGIHFVIRLPRSIYARQLSTLRIRC